MGAYAFVKTMCCILCIHSANATPPVFTSPLPAGGSSSMAETKTGGGVVVALQAFDQDGDTPTFIIASQTPSSPVFTIDGSDRVVVPSGGVDYENTTSFNFIFRVTAGGETATTTYVLTITNVDDESPVFTNAAYTKTITEKAANGTTLVTVTATDVDSSSISYSIAGAQFAFGINAAGDVTVTDQAQLSGLKPTVILTIQANDGTNPIGTASLTITILDDPCTSNPCQSGGNCSSSGETTYSCTCTAQYTGPQCQFANLCYIRPCQNGATCTPKNNTYECKCTQCFQFTNCTGETNMKCNGRKCNSEEDKCECSALDGNQEDCQCKNCHIATICCCLLVVFGTVVLTYCWLRYRSWRDSEHNTEKPRTLQMWLSAGCPSGKPNRSTESSGDMPEKSDYPVGTRRLEPLPKSQPPVSYIRRPLPDISK